jgi:predicted alpha/beta superfamily hydrolase
MITAVACLGLAGVSCIALAEQAAAPQPATVMMTQQIDFTSKVNGHTYRIQIAKPFGPPPAGGYPVLYVLDGDAYFGVFATGVRLRAMTNEIEPTVVVGIGYPDSQNDFTNTLARRNYDLTQADDANSGSRHVVNAMTAGNRIEFGHADEFYKVIETEIKPQVAAALEVNSARSVLFGHSLGGLFVLHTLFTHPKSFQTYLALSPSIFLAQRDVLKDEAAFSRRVTHGEVAPRIYIGVGGEEQSPSKYPLQPGMTREMEAKSIPESAMVDNARDLAGRLAALKGPPGYEVRSRIFEGETHIRVPFASINPVLTFALSRPKP